jgi:hypothetical protein
MTMSHVLEIMFRLARFRHAPSLCRNGAASTGLGSIEPLACIVPAENELLPESGRSWDGR